MCKSKSKQPGPSLTVSLTVKPRKLYRLLPLRHCRIRVLSSQRPDTWTELSFRLFPDSSGFSLISSSLCSTSLRALSKPNLTGDLIVEKHIGLTWQGGEGYIGSSQFILHLHTLRKQQFFSLKVNGKPLALKFNSYYLCYLGPNGHCYFWSS